MFQFMASTGQNRKICLKRSLNGRFNNLPCTFCLSLQFDSSEKEWDQNGKEMKCEWQLWKRWQLLTANWFIDCWKKKLNFPCFAWELTHIFSLVTQTGNWDLHYSRYEIFRFQNLYNYYAGTTAASIDVTNSKIVQFSCFVHFSF